MRPVVVRVGPLAPASANAVALAQAGAAAAPLALNGALAAPVTALVPGFGPGTGLVTSQVATLDTPRRVGITSSGNDGAITFAVAGLDRAGNPIAETVAGANAGTAQTALDYARVSSVTPSGATAGTVTVGTTAAASSAWVRLDDNVASTASVQCVATGTVTAQIEQTLDNPNSLTDPVAPAAMTWVQHPDPASPIQSQGQGAVVQTNYAELPLFARVTITSGAGSVVATFAQAGKGSPS